MAKKHRYSKGGIKLDAGKPPVMRGVFMRFPRAMREIARVSAVGTRKYNLPISDMTFTAVEDGEGRYMDALGRHILEEILDGPDNEENGETVLHAAQRAWDDLAALEIALIAREKGK